MAPITSLPLTAADQDGAAPRRPARQQKSPLFWLGFLLTIIYMGLVAFMTLWPVHIDDNAAGGFLHDLLDSAHAAGYLPGWFTYNFVEWLSNVIMFMPGGFLLCLLLKPPARFRVPLAGLCTSVGIETIQFFMPERTSSFLDIVANTLGASLGWGLGFAALRIYKNRQK